MELHLTPLTPIWTGDAEGVSATLRITGLMGSFRWWFEGIVRAAGRYSCDPTEEACRFDPDPKKKPLHGLCSACWLFGATGWARRFRLTGSGLHSSDWCVFADPAVARLHENWLRRVYKPGSKVLWGDTLALQLTHHFPGKSKSPGDSDLDDVLCGLIAVIARVGAVAAKTQNGFGVVDWREKPQFDQTALSRFINAFPEDDRDTDGMFNLAETTFFEFTVPDAGIYAAQKAFKMPASANPDYLGRVLPVAYDVRYKSRSRQFRTGAGDDRGIRPMLKKLLGRQAEEITGTAARSGNRSASRVFVSHLYRRTPREPYRMRCWVHIPRGLVRHRSAIVETIRTFIVRDMFPGSSCKEYAWSDVHKDVL